MSAYSVGLVTLVPELWSNLLGPSSGLVGKAFVDGQATLHVANLREYGKGKHQQVDDAPFGGGAGMVLQVEPLHRAISDIKKKVAGPVIALSPRGAPLTQTRVVDLAAGGGMTLVCGRYEGFDERVYAYVDEEISVGDFVLSAGDPAAWCLIDAVVRLLPGVLGNAASIGDESFSHGLLEYPHYSRPSNYQGSTVPDVLLSGDHQAIATWRRQQSEALTRQKRPDLWVKRPKK